MIDQIRLAYINMKGARKGFRTASLKHSIYHILWNLEIRQKSGWYVHNPKCLRGKVFRFIRKKLGMFLLQPYFNEETARRINR